MVGRTLKISLYFGNYDSATGGRNWPSRVCDFTMAEDGFFWPEANARHFGRFVRRSIWRAYQFFFNFRHSAFLTSGLAVQQELQPPLRHPPK